MSRLVSGLDLSVVLMQAIVLKGHAWFRPCSWRGRGEALQVSSIEIITLVPCKGDVKSFEFRVKDLQQTDWEIVSPDVVFKERT